MRLPKGRVLRTVDPELLRALLRYDPETGALFWRERSPEMFIPSWEVAAGKAQEWNARHAGKPVFTTRTNGYLMGRVSSRALLAHRVAWAMHHGRWSEDYIDHINGVRDDNRLANLREVSVGENSRNCKRSSGNKSGVTGVFRCGDRWRAFITYRRTIHRLGTFDTKEEATAVRKAAERRFGFHENHGRER